MVDKLLLSLAVEVMEQADKYNEEVSVEETALDGVGEHIALVFLNYECNRIVIAGVEVVDCEEPVCLYILNTKMYEYAKAEGFDQKQMFEGFNDKIFLKATKEEFIDHITNITD